VAWRADFSGFYYSRYDEPKPGAALSEANFFNKLYFHRLGQKQTDDTLVYEERDKPKRSFGATTTPTVRYLVITADEGTDPKNAVLYLDQHKPTAAPVALVPELEAAYDFIGNRGSTFWFRTDRGAPRGRIVSIDVSKPQPTFVELVGEQPETLQQVERVGGKFRPGT